MKVLIAHACPAVRHELRDLLEARGYEVAQAGDADALLAELARVAPDVTLLDGQLSRDAGTSLISRIKSHPDAYFSAVVLIDRAMSTEEAERQLDSGAHDFLIEPLRPAEVIARVQAAARTRSLQEELLLQGRRLEALIFEDPLTQLYNRRFMLNQLQALVSRSRRHRRPLSLVMLDIDHFKSVNDRHGHDVGDRVLATAAHAMRQRLRAEDYLGRLGGEEFLALLPDSDEQAAAEVAEALRETVGETSVASGEGPVTVSASVGYAAWNGEESPGGLLKRADDAMYRAKAAGRDTIAPG